MESKYLHPIFKTLYGKQFDYTDPEQKELMSNTIYLLEEYGIPLDYKFKWFSNKPYSQSLQNDLQYENQKEHQEITLRKEYIKKIETMHKLVHSKAKGSYSLPQWLLALASLHYLKKTVMPYNSSPHELLKKLEENPKLNNHNANLKAYKLIANVF